MAPEQFRNAKNADVRCDIYSLGATLYMMVTGELPFKASGPLDAWMKKIHNELTPPRRLVPDLSERVDWAIRRAMSADPEPAAGHLPRVHRRPDRPLHPQAGAAGAGQSAVHASRTSGTWSTRTTKA